MEEIALDETNYQTADYLYISVWNRFCTHRLDTFAGGQRAVHRLFQRAISRKLFIYRST